MLAPAINKEEELHWLALRLIPGLGMRKAGQLLDRFRTPQAIFRASREELEAAGLSGSVAQTIASGCTFDDAVDQQQKMLETARPCSSPSPTRAIRRGCGRSTIRRWCCSRAAGVELLQSVMLGVVGTRRPTPYGTAAAERLSADLAQAGLTIASGMARGIDTAAHQAPRSRSAATPWRSSAAAWTWSIRRRTASWPPKSPKRACWSPSSPWARPPIPQNFPIRNRIISGMSAGVLVVEGAQYSGSAITARLALDQEREVFAVPGNITSKMSWGPNLLIKQGAKLVQEWNDVLVELPAEIRRALDRKAQARLGVMSLELAGRESSSLPPELRRRQPRAAGASCRSTCPSTSTSCIESLETLLVIRDNCRTVRTGDARAGPAAPGQELC